MFGVLFIYHTMMNIMLDGEGLGFQKTFKKLVLLIWKWSLNSDYTAHIFSSCSNIHSSLSATLSSFSLSPPWTSFLSLAHSFCPWITSFVPPFLRFVLFVFVWVWKQWSWGHLFPPGSSLWVYALPANNTCGSLLLLPEDEGVTTWRGCGLLLNSPTLCHPRFPLPDELWLALLIVRAQQTNVGCFMGLSSLHLPSLLKKLNL